MSQYIEWRQTLVNNVCAILSSHIFLFTFPKVTKLNRVRRRQASQEFRLCWVYW